MTRESQHGHCDKMCCEGVRLRALRGKGILDRENATCKGTNGLSLFEKLSMWPEWGEMSIVDIQIIEGFEGHD